VIKKKEIYLSEYRNTEGACQRIRLFIDEACLTKRPRHHTCFSSAEIKAQWRKRQSSCDLKQKVMIRRGVL